MNILARVVWSKGWCQGPQAAAIEIPSRSSLPGKALIRKGVTNVLKRLKDMETGVAANQRPFARLARSSSHNIYSIEKRTLPVEHGPFYRLPLYRRATVLFTYEGRAGFLSFVSMPLILEGAWSPLSCIACWAVRERWMPVLVLTHPYHLVRTVRPSRCVCAWGLDTDCLVRHRKN